MIAVTVKNRKAVAVPLSPVTSGAVGVPVVFSFTEDWEGLAKTAVFKGSDEEIDVLLVDDRCELPWETVEDPYGQLEIGVYGANGAGTKVIPTIWARIDRIELGADLSGVTPAEPTPEMWAQMEELAETAGAANALIAEGYALGTQDGTPVESGTYYHNNSKYYSEQASASATAAATAQGLAETAQGLAETAQAAAETAQGKAEDAQEAIEDMSVSANTLPEGSSATVTKTVDPETGAVTLVFGIPKGADGQDGQDGYSPSASVSQSGDVTTISITDKDGTTTAEIDLSDYSINKADVIVSSASGAIASFPDGMSAPIKGTEIEIEPIQDLHGYDSPWPAGGGVNLYAGVLSAQTKNGVTIEPTSDGEIWIHGTPDIASDYISFGIGSVVSEKVLNQTVTVSINEKTVGVGFTFGGAGALNLTLSDTVTTKTANYGASTGDCYINVRYDVGAINKKYKIQIEIGSIATPWTPHSNICPISGHTQCKVWRANENLIDLKNITAQVVQGTYKTFLREGTYYAVRFASYANMNTLLHCSETESGAYVQIPTNNSNDLANVNATMQWSVAKSILTIKKPCWISPQYNSNAGYDNPMSFILTTDKSVYDSAITGAMPVGGDYYNALFTPYQGNTYPITFPETIYGGTDEVVSGQGSSTMGMVDLGTLSWVYDSGGGNPYFYSMNFNAKPKADQSLLNNAICSQYEQKGYNAVNGNNGKFGISTGGGILKVCDTRYTDKTAFKTAMSGVQLCYELATPQPFTHEPTQITTLKGQNNVWADTGDVSLDYRCDTKLYINKKLAELVAQIVNS